MIGTLPLGSAVLVGVNDTTDYTVLPIQNPSVITAVAHVQQGLSVPKFLIGGRGGGAQNNHLLLKKSTTHQFNLWQSQRFIIGQSFNVERVEFSLTEPLATGMKVVPVLRFDNEERSVSGTVIDSTNYTSENGVILTPSDFDYDVHGTKDFYLELQFWGTTMVGVTLPIEIIIETENVG